MLSWMSGWVCGFGRRGGVNGVWEEVWQSWGMVDVEEVSRFE